MRTDSNRSALRVLPVVAVLALALWGQEAGAEPWQAWCPADPAAASRAWAISEANDEPSPWTPLGTHRDEPRRAIADPPVLSNLGLDSELWQVGDAQRQVYLVSRSLKVFPGLGSHLFVALGRFPGDPAAEIFSFTKGRGNRVRRTHGQAHRFDWAAWLALDGDFSPDRRWLRGLNAEILAAPPWVVRRLAEEVVESMPYRLFGTNSNTVAQAIANRASGDDVRVFENRPFGSLGAGRWREVEFRSLAPEAIALCWAPRPPGLVVPGTRLAALAEGAGPGDLASADWALSARP